MFRIAFYSVRGNCRGHIAQSLAQLRAPQDVEIINLAEESNPPVPQAVEVMEELGFNISNHVSLTVEDLGIKPIDLVIELTESIVVNRFILPGMPSVIKWALPGSFKSDEEGTIKKIRELRDQLRKLIDDFFDNGYLATVMNTQRNYELIMDQFQDGVMAHDANGKITWINKKAEEVIGLDRHQIIGRDCLEMFPDKFCGAHCERCHVAPRTVEQMNYPVKLSSDDGQDRYMDMSVVQLRDEHEQFQGVLACFRDVTEVTELRYQLKSVQSFHGIIGEDENMQVVYQMIRDMAPSDCPVLIQGESGTGKELVATAIHGESKRFGQPLVTVNCAALPEGILESELFGHVKGAFTGAVRDKKGRFELANGGTIFLDEIGELTMNMQVKLLRVLQEQIIDPVGADHQVKINVRVISATNKNLKEMIKEGTFREDLFYRLCVVPIMMPPLRERRTDIPQLVNHYIQRFSQQAGSKVQRVSADAMHLFLDYSWPGNIRELQNALQYSLIKCKGKILEPQHLPMEITSVQNNSPSTKVGRRRKLNDDEVAQALQEANGNKLQAAKLLGVGRATLYRFLEHSGS